MWNRARKWLGRLRPGPTLWVTGSLLLSAFFLFQGIQRLASGRATALEPTPNRARAKATWLSEPLDPFELGEDLLERNIFDSLSGPLSWDSPETLALAEDVAGEDEETGEIVASKPCPDDVRLFASVVNGRSDARSFAALRKDGKTHLLGLGEALGDLQLVAIFPTHAYLRDAAGQHCKLPVYLSGPDSPPPPPPPAPEPEKKKEPAERSTSRRPPAFSEEDLQKNIRALGPNHYAVTRDLFLRARKNPAGISRGTRFVAHVEDGRPVGMFVKKIREDSLLSHLGLKQGDVIRHVNGYNLGTPDGVLEAFGHLGKTDTLTLILEREGKKQTYRYDLQ